jgi:putative ABC transport system ATP-binding protein
VSAQLLSGKGLSVQFGPVAALRGVTVEVRAGHMLCVTGPSGAGKTTLLHVLAGIQEPTDGYVMVDGSPLQPAAPVSFVPQTYGLSPVLTALESVALPMQVGRVPRAEVEQRASAALTSVGLGRFATRLTNALSGGQQQRVAVARALALDAPVVVADEPTSELDADNRALVLSLLREMANRGRIVVLASDDELVAAQCDESVALEDGEVVPV